MESNMPGETRGVGRRGLWENKELVDAVQLTRVRHPELNVVQLHGLIRQEVDTKADGASVWYPSMNGLRNLLHRLGPAPDPYLATEWTPSTDESAEETTFLKQLGLISLTVLRRPLLQHEAGIAKQIRATIVGIDLFVQWLLVREYAVRRESQLILGHDEADTSDLDLLMASQPWRSSLNSTLHTAMWNRHVGTRTEVIPGYEGWAWPELPELMNKIEFVDWVSRELGLPPPKMALGGSPPSEDRTNFNWQWIVGFEVERDQHVWLDAVKRNFKLNFGNSK
jgi:hypothetical protein